MISCCFWRKIILLNTSFTGSYLFYRGLSFITGGYPNELTINL
jgi:hypothetical protein